MNKKRRLDLRLSECGLYATASKVDLARRLSTPKHQVLPDELEALALDHGNFKVFPVTNAVGKTRQIQEPKPRLQRIHGRIHTLLSRVAPPDYLHSAIRKRSYISNAAAHDPSMPAVKIDVKKFFPSVTRAAIFNFFEGPMKCRRDVAGLLADLLSYEARLPTGSAASPIMAFYAYKPMFDQIDQLAKARGLVMSCYVDDMTISGPSANNKLLLELRRMISRHGLKSHKAHAFRALQPKIITGVCNTSSGARVPNKLHLKIKDGFAELAAAATLQAKGKVLGPLLGRLEAAGQIDARFKARAKTVRSLFAKQVSASE